MRNQREKDVTRLMQVRCNVQLLGPEKPLEISMAFAMWWTAAASAPARAALACHLPDPLVSLSVGCIKAHDAPLLAGRRSGHIPHGGTEDGPVRRYGCRGAVEQCSCSCSGRPCTDCQQEDCAASSSSSSSPCTAGCWTWHQQGDGRGAGATEQQ